MQHAKQLGEPGQTRECACACGRRGGSVKVGIARAPSRRNRPTHSSMNPKTCGARHADGARLRRRTSAASGGGARKCGGVREDTTSGKGGIRAVAR
eukprot:1917476-Pleurochrysis_carterae.AAC.2